MIMMYGKKIDDEFLKGCDLEELTAMLLEYIRWKYDMKVDEEFLCPFHRAIQKELDRLCSP